jgi:UDP-N-acetylmuramoyl-L-alanyl-D-glutamate--2,6-diaminopimelate ligase
MLAIVALHQAGVPLDAASSGVRECTGVPGRMERVDAGQPFLALVDYAHTPEAVRSLLAAVRSLTPGRVIAVLGCGGDRDPSKRRLMGAALAEGADIAVLTSDNPRSEDPLAILAEMASGAPDGIVVPDRGEAIRFAVGQAAAGDVVVVAGKGHEAGQEYADHTVPFDDRDVLRTALLAAGSVA